MAKGIKGMKDGLIFGAIFGILAVMAITFETSPLGFLDFLITWLDSLLIWMSGPTSTWWPFTSADWYCAITPCSNTLRYVFAGIIGAVIGGWIDRT